MARTNIAAGTLLGAYPALPLSSGGADLTFAAADVPNGNSTPIVDGKTVVAVYNSDSASHTVTFNSVADALGRKGDITTYSVGAGKVSLFGPFKTIGWANAGVLQIDGSHADIGLAVITLP